MEVLRRLEAAGFRLKIEKGFFGLKELLYLGYIISGEGLKPNPNKVKAINELKTPEDTRQLRAGLGLVNYYGKFIPKLSHEAAPLNRLLKKPWRSLEMGGRTRDSLEKNQGLVGIFRSSLLLQPRPAFEVVV